MVLAHCGSLFLDPAALAEVQSYHICFAGHEKVGFSLAAPYDNLWYFAIFASIIFCQQFDRLRLIAAACRWLWLPWLRHDLITSALQDRRKSALPQLHPMTICGSCAIFSTVFCC